MARCLSLSIIELKQELAHCLNHLSTLCYELSKFMSCHIRMPPLRVSIFPEPLHGYSDEPLRWSIPCYFELNSLKGLCCTLLVIIWRCHIAENLVKGYNEPRVQALVISQVVMMAF